MSKKVYVLAQFKPKPGKQNELFDVLKALEPDSLREDGCIQYIITRQIAHKDASNTQYSIVFNEIWQTAEAWTAHNARAQIQHFFQTHVVAEDGLVEDVIVTAYSDEGEHFDAPVFG